MLFAEQIFHCVHLECPSEDPNSLLIENEKQRLAEDKKQFKLNDTEPSTSREISSNKNSSRHSGEEHEKSIVEEDVLVQFDNNSMDEQ